VAQADETEEDAGESDPDPVVVPLVGEAVVEDQGGDQRDQPQHSAERNDAYVVCLHRLWIWTARRAHASRLCGTLRPRRCGGAA
jgi:hypothetical protein